MRTQITTLPPGKALLDLLRRDPPDAEIPDDSEEGMDERPAARAVRWNFILVWFMRMLALIWIAKGLGYWAVILGADSAPMPFESRSTGFQATTIYFAIIDLVAAVGLWLTSTWGGVLWLLAVMSHLILTVFFPRIVTGGPILIGLFLSFIVTYLLISWLAASEE
jgi:fatty acid desaturase